MLGSIEAALASLAVLIVMFVPLERAFPARRGQGVLRPALALDVGFFIGQYLVWNAASLFIVFQIGALAAQGVPEALKTRFLSLPFGTQAAVVIVLGDLAMYWFHRASHRFELLWRFHAVHHTSEHLDWVAAHREHPVDGTLTQLAANLPALLLGFSPRALAGVIVFRGAWAIFVHSNVRLPLGPLRWIFGAPELHHFHHARVPRMTKNFANLAPYLDLLFGTHHCPKGEESYALGVPGAPSSKGYLALLVDPFLDLVRSYGGRGGNLATSERPANQDQSLPLA